MGGEVVGFFFFVWVFLSIQYGRDTVSLHLSTINSEESSDICATPLGSFWSGVFQVWFLLF